jgi:plastocyanin
VRRLIPIVLTAFAAIAVPAPPAVAGGGCHGAATEGTGSMVVMEDMCFTPSIVHVDAGEPVRFENRDPMVHNLYGTGWGLDELAPGEAGSMTFADDGLYAFACTLHPGMTGTVVVGDGDGPGNGLSVAVAEDTPPAAPPPPTPEPSGSALPAGLIGLALGVVLTLGATSLLRSRGKLAGSPVPSVETPSA